MTAVLSSPNASAALALVNGDFQAGPGFGANVTGWFDGTNGPNDWDDTFQDTNSVSPQTGTTVVWSGNPNAKNFLYQAIGTKEAAYGTIDISIVVGDNASGSFTIGIYQSATFTGTDGTDVAGASGVTMIDSEFQSISYAAGVVGTETATLSLATANLTDTIFLRFHYGEDGVAEGWLKGDNVTMNVTAIPEPATTLLGFGGLGLLFFRKRR